MKYVGSKNRLSKELAPIIQSYITEDTEGYLEPFVGGANMIDKIRCKHRVGCDIHEELIELLRYVQVIDNELPYDISEKEYKDVRDNKEDYPKWFVGLVGFCATFGSKYFGGYARGFKADKITPRNISNEAIRNVEKQRESLYGIAFLNCDFRSINPNIYNHVIYCDPPYRGTTKYATEMFPHDDFYDWCVKMSKNNIVLISEYNMPEEQFECIWQKEHKTSLDVKTHKKRVEKLFIVKTK